MRVMPSVTDTMEPTLRASVTDLKFSIRCLISSLISVALIAISSVPWVVLGGQLVGDAVEPRAQRAVDDQVAGAQDSAADELGIRLTVQPHLALEASLERCRELLALRLIQRRRGSHRDVGH